MAHKKGQGSVRNGRDSVSKRLGVKEFGGQLVTAGGRVLGITGMGKTLADAQREAYRLARTISFEGCHFRTDIAHRALGPRI